MNEKINSQKFIDILEVKEEGDNKKIITWSDNPDTAIGFSIIRNYPEKGSFIPVKNKDGTNDSSVLIKIGYLPQYVEENKAYLIVSASKYSNYLSNRFRYDFNDPNAPTKEAVELSERSEQPLNVNGDKNEYYFCLKDNKIKETKNNKNISVNEVINRIYKSHIRTTTDIVFKTKNTLKKVMSNLPNIINPWLKRGFRFFKREFIEGEDYKVGLFEPYIFSRNIREKEINKVNLFNSGIVIKKQSVIITSLTLLILFILSFYFKIELLNFINFIGFNINNQIFILSFIITFTFLVDFITDYLPVRVLFFLINIIVKIRLWSFKPTRIK